jgi:acyl carrier protein
MRQLTLLPVVMTATLWSPASFPGAPGAIPSRDRETMPVIAVQNKSWDRSSVFAAIRRVIVEQLHVEESRVTLEARFVEDLGIDSLGTVNVLLSFEEEFAIDIPDETCEQMRTVGQAVDGILKLVSR